MVKIKSFGKLLTQKKHFSSVADTLNTFKFSNNSSSSFDLNNEGKSIFARWINSEPIPEHVERTLSNLLVSRGNFGHIIFDNNVENYIKDNSVSFAQAHSLRSWILRDKAYRNQPKLNSVPPQELLYSYETGSSILDFATKFDVPPLNIFRILFRNKYGYNKRFSNVMKDPHQYLTGRDLSEFLEACKHDSITNPEASSEASIASLKFEQEIETFLNKEGLLFKNQTKLTAEQKQLGNITHTPDWLILDRLFINNHRINWIDAKSDYGCDVHLYVTHLLKQTSKYLERLGTGAIIFKHGFGSSLVLPGILFLDASYIFKKNNNQYL